MMEVVKSLKNLYVHFNQGDKMTLLEQKAQLKEQLQSINQELNALQEADPESLSPEERRQAIFALPELTEEHMNSLKQSGFQTGSTIFGDPSKADDIDFCIIGPPVMFNHHALGINKKSREEYWNYQNDFSSIKGHYKEAIINIICFSNYDLYDAWREATRVMAYLIISNKNSKHAIETKWKRVRVFRALVDVLREDYQKSHMQESKHLRDDLSIEQAVSYQVCLHCGREAINFTCKPIRDIYLDTAICERCQSKVNSNDTIL